MNRGFPWLCWTQIFVGVIGLTSCVDRIPIENRPCPCAAGWTCCAATQLCILDERYSSECPSNLDGSVDRNDDSGVDVTDTVTPDPSAWAIAIGGGAEQYGVKFVLDPQGNLLLVGTFRGTVDFGTYQLKSVDGSFDVFVAKMDALGNFIWASSVGGALSDTGLAIAIGGNGDVFVAGAVQTGPQNTDSFVAKLDRDGNFGWTATIASPDDNLATGVAVDPTGDVIITGWYQGMLGSSGPTAMGDRDVFILKLRASNGEQRWLKTAGGAASDIPSAGIVTDSEGNSFVAGYFSGTAKFETHELTASIKDPPGEPQADIFVTKLNSTGQFLWATRAGGIDTDGAGQIRIDIFDNVYIAGWFTGKAEFGTLSTESADDKQRTYLAKITQDGHFNRLITAEGPTDWLITDMAIDRDGNSFLVGSMVLTINPPNVDTNAIALKLSPDGKNLWQKYAGGNGRDIGTAIGIDGKGAVYVGGSFQGDGRFGQTDLTSNGSDNIFIWKLKDIP